MGLVPSAKEIILAKESSRSLARTLSKKNEQVRFKIISENQQSNDIIMPSSALKLLVNILTEMAQGNAVTILPINAELTTQQAADLLNVSRPFLIKLLDEGKIPYRKVGRHRRVSANEILNFKKQQNLSAENAIDELVSEAQSLKLGYE